MSVSTPERVDAAPAGTRPATSRVRRGLRPEIQALRAVAVAVVVVYHLRPAALPGGYVGVDVFFVISGFLISRHLLTEAERTGSVDLARFWAGRVRRILPGALVTVIAVVAAATLLLPRTAAAEIGRTGIWAALSGANWLFAAQSVDYEAQSPDASPFEHYWSLGVEEQFYLLWPLAVLAVAVLARRRSQGVRRLVLVPFGAVLAASLVFGVWFTATGSAAAYFVTPTRMWELAAGGLLAALLADRQPPARLALPLQAAGLLAIVVGTVRYDATTPMPGVAAVLPVAGALAFVAAGDAPVLRRMWAVRPIRLLGDTSYSLYLWHWPILVIGRSVLGHQPGLLGLAAVLVASVLAAALSYRFVEQPFRRARMHRPLRVVAIGGVAIAVAVAVTVAPIGLDRAASARETTARTAVLDPAGGAPIGWAQFRGDASRTWARPQHVVVPDPALAPRSSPLNGCTTAPESSTSPVCVRGDADSPVTIALVGDSHARQWGGALERLAEAHHWRLVTILHNSCPFSLHPRPLELQGGSHCTDAVRASLADLRAQHPSVVITSTWRGSYGGGTRAAADGYAAMWRSLEADGMRVIAIGDTPAPGKDPTVADCAAGNDPGACGRSRARATGTEDPLHRAARTAGAPFLDPVDAFCGTTWCPGVVGNVLVYRDDNHVTDAYMTTLVPWLDRRLGTMVDRELARG